MKVIDFFCGAGGFSEGFKQDEIKIFKNKDVIPLNQLFSLYAVNLLCSLANSKK